jgi:DNA topoisomerase-1
MALKDLKPGVAVKLDSLTNDEHKTTPPSRFSEVKLVSELESRDIGRPSTYSSIVSLIQDRGYVAKKGTQLYPTALGFAVARLLAAKLPTFTAYDYTAKMETALDGIADGKQSRSQFLGSFWNGQDGFASQLDDLLKTIDFKELEQYSTIDLHNGYSVRFSKFGTFLQADDGVPNEKGYVPSARLEDAVDVWEYKDPEVCREAMEKAVNKVEARELGVLESGEYTGWTVVARDGRLGPYVQAMHPDNVKASAAGKKPAASVPQPINHKLPEGTTVEDVEMKDISELFADVKLPRWSPDKKWLVGIGKKGAYIGRKATPRGRPVFRSLPVEHDPKRIPFEEVQRLWDEAVAEAAAKAKAKAEKAAAPKAAPKPKVTKPKAAAKPRVTKPKAPAKK